MSTLTKIPPLFHQQPLQFIADFFL